MKVFRTSLLAVCFSFLSTMGIGQHCDICTRALVTDYISFELDEETALHYLNIVDKESYRESKEKGGFGIKIPFGDMISGFEGDYDSFRSRREELYKKYEFEATRETSINILSKTVRDHSLDVFDNCVKNNCSGPGLYVQPFENRAKYVKVEVFYRPATTGGAIGVLKVKDSEVIGGWVNGVAKGKLVDQGYALPPLSRDIITIWKNDPKQEISGTLKAGGYAVPFNVPVYKDRSSTVKCATDVIEIDVCPRNKGLAKGVCCTCHKFGNGILQSERGQKYNYSPYKVEFKCSGKYRVEVFYTSWEERPLSVKIDGRTVIERACGTNTEGWHTNNLKWEGQGEVYIEAGTHLFELERDGPFPSLRKVKLTYVE